MAWLKRLICRYRGHLWAFECDGLKRRCPRCHREDWVTGNPHPMIGEPKYYWRTMRGGSSKNLSAEGMVE